MTTDRRAFSILNVKSMSEDQRIIEGMATTPTPDRIGDIVEPLGVKFAPEIALLWQHQSDKPVGLVKFGKPTKDGIPFTARIPHVAEPGVLKDRIDEAWQSVKHRLVSAVSIGFRILDNAVEPLKNGGLRFLKTEVMELSLVTIPANAEATITTIKSLDDAQRGAAPGSLPLVERRNTAGASAFTSTRSKERPMNTQEQIQSAQNKRAADAARLAALMKTAAEDGNRGLNETETEEYDGIAAEIRSTDAHLKRLRDHEALMQSTAEPVMATVKGDVTGESAPRGPVAPIRYGPSSHPKGYAFTRYCMIKAAAKGNRGEELELASECKDSLPQVYNAIKNRSQDKVEKAAVAGGTTTDADFAEPLVEYQTMASEFLDILRPKTIIGRIPGLRRVPFNIRVASKTQSSTVGWVGEGAAKPVSEVHFAEQTLGFAKAAGIVVISQELARFSSPSAVELIQRDLTDTMVQFLDQEFIDPSNAPVANVSPASVTYGASKITATGTTVSTITADLAGLMALFIAAEMAPENGVLIMRPETAMGLSLKRTSQDIFAFPDITMNGGTLMGLPVIVSRSVPSSTSGGSIIVMLDGSEIFLADDGGVRIDVSEQASLQMDSAPTNANATPTTLVSLWQTNQIGIRCERFINWGKRRTTAVAYIDAVPSYV